MDCHSQSLGASALYRWAKGPPPTGTRACPSLQLRRARARPLTSKVTGGMTDRRLGVSEPSCSKALTCGYTCMTPEVGRRREASSVGTEPEARRPRAWALSEPGGDRRKKSPEKLQDPGYLIFNRGQQACQLAELGHHVDRAGLTRHLGGEETSKSGHIHCVAAAESSDPKRFPRLIAPHSPNNPEGLSFAPFADKEIKDVAHCLKCVVAEKQVIFSSL